MNANPQMIEPLVLRADDGRGVVTLTLNRGSRFNALSMEMIAALQGEINKLSEDRSARVVVLAGAGKGFCAGHDLKEMRAHAGDEAWGRKLFDDCGRLMVSLTRLPQPVIARVHGIATAAGCQLVSMCDLAIAAEVAVFALPGVNVGVFCSTPAVGVARNIGRKRAMEMLLSGGAISAAQALDWGLVNRVVSVEKLDETVAAMAGAIAAKSAAVIALGKSAFYTQIERGLDAAYDLTSGTMACNLGLSDAAEGMDAFIGKRSPRWS
jgi:enoyl-CoA hydratase/carnithine racemase